MHKQTILYFTYLITVCSIIGCSQLAEINPPNAINQVTPTALSPSTAEPQESITPAIAAQTEANPAEVTLLAAEYTIIPGESSARFELDEDLRSALTGWHRGSRITVVGTTDQVFGSISLVPLNLNATQLNNIQIDAFALDTDDYYRTRAIQKHILESEIYRYITFVPTDIRGLPETATIGDEVQFRLDGELTIREVTLPQTFEVTAILVSADRLEGTAAAVVDRDSYQLVIPGVPHVSNIESDVELYIDFVAISQ